MIGKLIQKELPGYPFQTTPVYFEVARAYNTTSFKILWNTLHQFYESPLYLKGCKICIPIVIIFLFIFL